MLGEATVMNVLAQNLFYILIVILLLAVHLFGFGCRHSHSAHQRRRQNHRCREPRKITCASLLTGCSCLESVVLGVTA